MNQYFEQMVLSASPVELIRLLYQKAIASTRNAREHLKHGRIAERCSAINNAYMVIAELAAALRSDEAPELAGRLGGLYVYIQQRLLEANLKQQDGPLAEVLGLLITLGESWNSLHDGQSAPEERWAAAGISTEDPGRIAYSA